MKTYKIFRWLMKASALTAVMFVMQACYGSPYMPPEKPDDTDVTGETDTFVSSDLQPADAEYQDLQPEMNVEAD